MATTKKFTTITVTDQDIERAKRNQSARCVVATAIANSVEGAHHVSIDLQTIRYTVAGERYVYLTPPAASGYVIAFDAGDPIHPFAFRLSEDHRVHVRRDVKTPAAHERNRTRTAAKEATDRVVKLEQAIPTIDDPDEQRAAEAALTVARTKAAKAEAKHAETMEQHAGEPWRVSDETPDPGTGRRKRKAPAQVYRRGIRAYGQRALRINQAPDTPEERSARQGVMVGYDRYSDAGPAVPLD